MNTTEADVVNGIDVDALKAAVEVIKENPDLGRFRFRARNRWIYGPHCATTIQDFWAGDEEDTSRAMPFTLEADEPAVLMGFDNGPNATEMALAALASCLNATFMFNAAAQGIHIDELQIDLEGNLDLRGFLGISEDVRRGYEAIQVTFRVKSDASEEKIKELVELAQKRSPVFDIVTNQTPVSVRVERVEPSYAERTAAHI